MGTIDELEGLETNVQSVQNVHPIAEFPVDAFPEFFQQLINDYRDTLGFQRSYSAMSILSVISTCIGNAVKVKVKRGWTESPILYGALYGDSSRKKTPVLNTFLVPFFKLEEVYQAIYEREVSEWEMAEEKGPRPKRKHIIINDATPESIIDIHSNNKKSLFYHNDELVAMVKRFSQYRNGPDQEFWLSQWSNTGVKITRKTQETIYFNKPFITILGGIQPVMINELAKDNRLDNGFLYRILFVLPEDDSAEQWTEEEIDTTQIQQYDDFIEILNNAFNNIPCDDEPLEMEFSPEAKGIFITWFNRNGAVIHDSQDDFIKSIFKKLEAYYIRLSLILEVLYSGGKDLDSIGKEAAIGAIKLVEYFRNTALYIYQKIRDEEFKDEIDKGIYESLPDEFKTSELINIAWDNYAINSNTVKKRIIPRFERDRLIERVSHGHYKKLNEGVHYVHYVHDEDKESVQSVQNVQSTRGNNGYTKQERREQIAWILFKEIDWNQLNEEQQERIDNQLGVNN